VFEPERVGVQQAGVGLALGAAGKPFWTIAARRFGLKRRTSAVPLFRRQIKNDAGAVVGFADNAQTARMGLRDALREG